MPYGGATGLRLNIGCGDVYFDGWVNIDRDSPKADLKMDIRAALPYGDNRKRVSRK